MFLLTCSFLLPAQLQELLRSLETHRATFTKTAQHEYLFSKFKFIFDKLTSGSIRHPIPSLKLRRYNLPDVWKYSKSKFRVIRKVMENTSNFPGSHDRKGFGKSVTSFQEKLSLQDFASFHGFFNIILRLIKSDFTVYYLS